jgi:apyrase
VCLLARIALHCNTLNAQANYLEGTLQPALLTVHEGGELNSVETVGALDLGGASTQITFVPAAGTVWNDMDKSTLRLYGEELELYTHSYLCYGQVQMTNRRRALLLNRTDSSATSVVDPCVPSVYTAPAWTADNLTELLANPCILGFTSFDVQAFVGKSLVGGGNGGECNASLQVIFFLTTQLTPGNQNHLAPTHSPTTATSTFYPHQLQHFAL